MATPEYKIHGIPVRAVPDSSLPEGQSPCKCCAMYAYPECGPKVQIAAGFVNCLEGRHHYEAVQ